MESPTQTVGRIEGEETRELYGKRGRMPRLSRSLRKVGFHERQSVAILILDMGSQSPHPLFAKARKEGWGTRTPLTPFVCQVRGEPQANVVGRPLSGRVA
jgi:hypothetical protein